MRLLVALLPTFINTYHRQSMRQPLVLCTTLAVSTALTSIAGAATIIVSPSGSDPAACTRAAPCSLTFAAHNAKAGDTVILLDGLYKTQLLVTNSGTPSAYITFRADDCATPILEGIGVETATGVDAVDQPTGVGSSTATYLRFVGLVSRGWNTGFGNGWTGERTTNSNGHFEYVHCIADGNGRTGFTFYSAEGLHVQNCIAAHNGSSVAHSWSSGMTLYEAQGTTNLIEGSISFENTDAERHTDGSGFIADESSNNATFLNNIAFRNGGSCLRLTTSSGIKFINNTCYHNALDPQATGPTNPGEIYFTNDATRVGVTVKNNVFVSTGTGAGAEAVLGQPSTGWSNNVVQNGGNATFFTDPEGTNPDFTLTSTATSLIGKGSVGGGAPGTDIGFDPKCIVKRPPTMLGDYQRSSWWQYSIDYDYIRRIGGVAQCFHPKNRPTTNDIGAYASGTVTTSSGSCTPTTGGTSGAGGTSATGGSQSSSSGATGNAASDGGGPSHDAGGSTASTASTGGSAPPDSGCTCRTHLGSAPRQSLYLLLALSAALGFIRRHRR